MGDVIDLAERREARRRATEAVRARTNDSVARLEHAVAEILQQHGFRTGAFVSSMA